MDRPLGGRGEQVADGVGVIFQQGKVFGIGDVEALLFLHDVAKDEHPQADVDGVIVIFAGDVDMGPRFGEQLDQSVDLGFQVELAQPVSPPLG